MGVDPPINLSPAEQLELVRKLFVQLLAHDEVLAARRLLDAAPWQVRDSAEIQQMKMLVGAMLPHVNNPSVMEQLYAQYGASEALPLDAEIPPQWSQTPRYEFALGHVARACEILAELGRVPDVLDIATSDGWIANRLGMRTRANVYGIDVSQAAVDLARTRADTFATRARFARCLFAQSPLPSEWPSMFDVILLFEVYEHVADTRRLLKAAASRLRPGGSLLVTTPRGSWLNGYQMPFHEKWNEPKPREHIRAPTLGDLVSDTSAVGLVPVEGKVVEMPMPDVPGQASILFRAIRPIDGGSPLASSGFAGSR